MQSNKPDPKIKGCSFIIAIGFFVFLYFIFFSSFDEPVKNKKQVNDKTDALIMSHQFVTQRLKAPATAEFGSESEGNVTQLNDSTFLVNSYVDSENSFSAKLRANYSCKITFTSYDMARCEGLVIQEN